MSSNPHAKMVDIFLDACDLEEPELSQFLRRACTGNAALRADVEKLLMHDRTRAAIDQPVIHFQDKNSNQTEHIGPYEINEVIGVGGMGMVYKARQSNPSRVVALKVLRPGMASRTLIRRFQQEAHLLGQLTDPGIAQIYEAGTAEGGNGPQPFFAMEYVDGTTLIDYVRKNGLAMEDRLELLVRICESVHHAHQKGIIHRDLKPGNILVTRDGRTKILDFGVARATDNDIRSTTMQTEIGQLIGTLPYMSPEQVAGNPAALDTRSDIYALGVLGYELLTGRLPHDLENCPVPEAVRLIRDEEPQRLSSFDRIYRGDIETIVAKAMEKEKNRRYASAQGLADDIRRFLTNEPITARPASAMYQFRKFARRNRAFVASVVIVAATLVIASVVSVGYAVEATHAERVARIEQGKAESAAAFAKTQQSEAESALAQSNAVTLFLTDMLVSAGPGMQGRDVKVRDILALAAENITERFSSSPLVEARIRAVIGRSYSVLGDPEAALPHLESALRVLREELGDENSDVLHTMEILAQAYLYLSRFEDAERVSMEYLNLATVNFGPKSNQVLDAKSSLARAYRGLGKVTEARPLLESVCAMWRDIEGPFGVNTMIATESLGQFFYEQMLYDEAEPYLTEAYEGELKNRGPDHARTVANQYSLAINLSGQRKHDRVLPLLEGCYERGKVAFGEDHGFVQAVRSKLATELGRVGRADEGEPLLLEALRIDKDKFGPDNPTVLQRMTMLGRFYTKLGRYDEAEELLQASSTGLESTLGENHPRTISALDSFGDVFRTSKQWKRAESIYRGALIRARTRGNENSAVVSLLNDCGIVLFKQQKFEEARAMFLEAVETGGKIFSEFDYRRGLFVGQLCLTLDELGLHEEAIPHLLEAHRLHSHLKGRLDPGAVGFLRRAAELAEETGDTEKAEIYREQHAALEREMDAAAEAPESYN